MDMKAAHLYLSLGGCYCYLCTFSKDQCAVPEFVRTGFEITREVTDLHTIFNDLADEDGNVVKKRNDYDIRQGLTNKPIPTNPVYSLQVLHSLLRGFDHFMKLAVHLRAEVFD